MIWSRYTDAALYVGDGMIIDATWKHGVKTRSLSELVSESNRFGVVRMQGLTPERASEVIAAARSKESSAYNFDGVKLLGEQKLRLLSAQPRPSLGAMIDLLGRAEYLPQGEMDGKKLGCSELIAFAFNEAGITLSQANGFTPGDIVRLSQAGVFTQLGTLRGPAR